MPPNLLLQRIRGSGRPLGIVGLYFMTKSYVREMANFGALKVIRANDLLFFVLKAASTEMMTESRGLRTRKEMATVTVLRKEATRGLEGRKEDPLIKAEKKKGSRGKIRPGK